MLVLATVAVTMMLVGWLALLAGAQGARGQAQSAADLGALAAAQDLVMGGDDPCGSAREVVALNRAELTTCELQVAGVVRVVAVVAAVAGRAEASARAGPQTARGASP